MRTLSETQISDKMKLCADCGFRRDRPIVFRRDAKGMSQGVKIQCKLDTTNKPRYAPNKCANRVQKNATD